MLSVFGDITNHVAFRRKVVQIDGLVFRLHYRLTFCLLLVCTILVSSRQYIGQHIKCIADEGVPSKVIETFCFFTKTFTVVRHLNSSSVPHPGVGPLNPEDPIIRHAYYQWVPFVLFAQALLFYIPHIVWKIMEGNQVKAIAVGFEHAALALSDKDMTVGGVTIPSADARRSLISNAGRVFLLRLHVNRHWALRLIFCELLNLANVMVQVWGMNSFLGGQFLGIGRLISGDVPDDGWDSLDVIFPKVTKCIFYKYGPTGSIQHHDALCVMALNVINEKIYVFLWFWFIFLFILSVMGLIYRLISMCLFSRSQWFNRCAFSYSCTVRLDPCSMTTITSWCSFSNWLFLHFVSLSVDSFVFRDLFDELAKSIADEMPRNKHASTYCKDDEKQKFGRQTYFKDFGDTKNGHTVYFEDEGNQQLIDPDSCELLYRQIQ